MNVKQLANVAKVAVKKNARLLCAIGTGVGLAATIALTVQATKKASKIVDQIKTDSGKEKLAPSEVVKATWKCYIPVAVAATVTGGCVAYGVVDSNRREGALATALAVTETAKTVYRDELSETSGPSAVEKADAKIIERTQPIIADTDMMVDNRPVLFEDGITNARFYVTPNAVKEAFSWADTEMSTGDEILLDSIWGRIGASIPGCWASENLVFTKDDHGNDKFTPRFTPKMTDDFHVYFRIEYPWQPEIV